MRARLGLTDPGPEGGNEDDELAPQIASDRRILTRHKSNYAKAGETLDLVVRDGVFFLTRTRGRRQAAQERARAQRRVRCEVPGTACRRR